MKFSASPIIGPRDESAAPDELDQLAESIRQHWETARGGEWQAVEANLAIGHALLTAREQIPSDKQFGQWFKGQRFEFSQQWSWTLQRAAEHEATIRALLTSQLVSRRPLNFEKAVKLAVNGTTESTDPSSVEVPEGRFSVITADPPWRYGNAVTRGSAEDHYPTMSLEDICALSSRVEGWAADNCHLYLWTTNGFLREAFEVVDAWGFTYKTCLTWVKPQIGMGNYFRVSTEHVLFGVKGNLPVQDRTLSNWFESPRGRHSAKPEMFYTLVQKASPGPYLEMFARVDGRLFRRDGWKFWGNEARVVDAVTGEIT